MKKLQAVAVLPLFALASCGQSQDTTAQVPTMEVGTVETSTNETTPVVETEALSNEITSTTTTTEGNTQRVEIKAPYTWPNGQASEFTATLVVTDGVVTSVEGLEGKMGAQEAFAPAFSEQVTGKELKGLQIDAVSGASLVSAAVNQFLTTVNQ